MGRTISTGASRPVRGYLRLIVPILAGIAACGGTDNAGLGEPAPVLGAMPASSLGLLVIGGTSGVGLETVRLALARGHRVTAMARRPERMTLTHPLLETLRGDILDAEAVDAAVAGKDAVVIAISTGPTPKPVSVFSDGTGNVLQAMEKRGIPRLIAVTGIGAGDSRGHGGFYYDRIEWPLLLKTIYADKDRQEALIRESPVGWTIVRPGFLTDDAGEIRYRVIGDLAGVTAGDIARADVAHFIVAALETESHLRATVLLTN